MQDAKAVIAKLHRHNKPPVSGKFAVAAEACGEVVGVVIAGRPVARPLDDKWTVELTRNATDGYRNACSFLYGAARRAAVALGYRRIYTYTLQSESGASLRAAGFVVDAILKPRATWSCASRPRTQTDLFGVEQRPAEAKVRWVWPASARSAESFGDDHATTSPAINDADRPARAVADVRVSEGRATDAVDVRRRDGGRRTPERDASAPTGGANPRLRDRAAGMGCGGAGRRRVDVLTVDASGSQPREVRA
jgi:hypothetical protein